MTKHTEPTTFQDDKIDLGEIVDALRGLRKASQQSRYRNRALPRLPSRGAIGEIVDALVATLYPRHFGPQDQTIDTLDGFIAATLERALQSLREK